MRMNSHVYHFWMPSTRAMQGDEQGREQKLWGDVDYTIIQRYRSKEQKPRHSYGEPWLPIYCAYGAVVGIVFTMVLYHLII